MEEKNTEILSQEVTPRSDLLIDQPVAIYETTAEVDVSTFTETYKDQYIQNEGDAPVDKVLPGESVTISSSSGDGSGIVTINSSAIANVVTSVSGVGSGLGFSLSGTVNGVGAITLTTPSAFQLYTSLGAAYQPIATITGATGVVEHNWSVAPAFYHTGILGNFTVNLTNLSLANNRSCNLVLILDQTSTPYLPMQLQIEGAPQDILWLNNHLPEGSPGKHDYVCFSITNVAGMYSVLGYITSYGADVGSVDPNYCANELLLHFNGSNGGSTFIDSSNYARTFSLSGAPITSTAQVKYGEASGYFNGSSWLTLDTSFSLTGNYTVEGWIYTTLNNFQVNYNGGNITMIGHGGSGAILGSSVGANSNNYITVTGTPTNQWYHFAIVQTGNLMTLYINGINSGTASTPGGGIAFSISSVGRYNSPFGSYNFTGYIDDIRATAGVARYTTDFVPPYEQFPDTAGYACPLPPSPDFYGALSVLPITVVANPGLFTTGAAPAVPISVFANPGLFTTGAISTVPISVSANPGLFTTGSVAQLPLNITPTDGDPNYGSVSLLLHFEGSNGSTTFIDNSPNPKVGLAGGSAPSAQISTTDFKFGSSSAYFGGNDFIQYSANSDLQFGSGDYSIEMWVKPTSVTPEQHLITVQNPATWSWTSSAFHMMIWGGVVYFRSFQGPTPLTISPIGSISAGVWSHVYAGRSGNRLYGAINGVITSIDCTGHSQNIVTQNVVLGRYGDYSDSLYYTGYMDEVRITKGVGRYTTNFTPPTEPFPDS